MSAVQKFAQGSTCSFLTFLPLLERTSHDPIQALQEQIILKAWHSAVGANSNGVVNTSNQSFPLPKDFTQRDARVATSLVLWLSSEAGNKFLFDLYRVYEDRTPNWRRAAISVAGLEDVIVPKSYGTAASDNGALHVVAMWLLTKDGRGFVKNCHNTLKVMGQRLDSGFKNLEPVVR